jgi:hypothetical protein
MRSQAPPPRDAGERPQDPEGEERYGPLGLERIIKEDGRALILYSRVEPPEKPRR